MVTSREPRVVSITQEQLATRALIEQGLAVSLVPSLLDEAFENVVLRPLDGPVPCRDVFALVPPGDRHPLLDEAVEALRQTARQRLAPADASSLAAGARDDH